MKKFFPLLFAAALLLSAVESCVDSQTLIAEAETLEELATMKYDEGNYEEALKLFEEEATILKNIFEDNPDFFEEAILEND